ncbi:MAG: ABC transporter permease, ATP-binding cassette, subfamily B, bacterial [candidate division WS6 bacterium GW2011_GWC1_36_11]|uniref:ABC transporter permease, ATP-binding cassette, subfamily B, bacterial n=1 Tax=candidate division WS6 bacterium GW2011_GWC1_36_11 TaxID=1619090 RepID=A0A0G0DSD5_9BACT|nr:MAG: ABC transporter permease, ATP-binding cassette, subfamily B, bacterial [candidate division WS6 bacterium GW2011_GWC1_36_11]
MILQKYKKKLTTLLNVLKFIYGRYTTVAVARDILFVVGTASEVYSITIAGKFIDEVAKILLKVWEDARYMMIAKVSKSNLQDVEQEKFQDLLTYAPAYSIDRIIQTYNSFSSIVSSVVRFVSAGIIIFETMSWSVLLLILFVLPEIVVVHIGRKKIRTYQDDEVGKLKYLNYLSNLTLTISNFLELRVNDTFAYAKRKYTQEYDEFLEGYLKKDANLYRNRAIISILGQSLKVGYVVYVLSFSIVKRFSLGTFKALYDYVDMAYGSMYSVLDSITYISSLLGYDEKFFDLMEYEGFGDHEHGIKKLGNNTPVVQLKNLSFSYPDDPSTLVLKHIDIEIKPGEKVAFFGGDGSGKSSMVKILSGLYQIKSGDYLLDGISVKDLDRGQLKKNIAVTFQDFINYNFSVRENVVISGERKNINKHLYNEVSRVSQITEFLKKEKIDESHILGKTFPGGKDLSPGYWQRLAISRMLYRNKKIFIMDESFTYIDSESKDILLQNIIKYIGENRTMIYITRSVEDLDLFDRIYFFENGKVVEVGNFKELMKKKKKFYKIANES